MAAFAAPEWHDFFVGSVGASAALTGLLFVAISINLEQILKFPHLPGRAAGTLGILLSVLVVSCFGLAPAQSDHVLGLEILAAGAAVSFQAAWVARRTRAHDEPIAWTLEPLISLLLPGLAFVAGGISLIVGGGGGLYWVLAAIVLAFLVASINAWVLLVEVVR